MNAVIVTDRWTCPRCQRPTVVKGTAGDVAAALEAIRTRHRDRHAAGDHYLDEVGLAGASARTTARQRREHSRAATRRRQARRSA